MAVNVSRSAAYNATDACTLTLGPYVVDEAGADHRHMADHFDYDASCLIQFLDFFYIIRMVTIQKQIFAPFYK
jgi:hypothetical protein